jgi:DNA-binding CsgD family transcriptional regulator
MSLTGGLVMNGIAEQFRQRIDGQPLDRASEILAQVASDMGWDLAAFMGDTTQRRLPRDQAGDYIARRMGWPAEYLAEWSRRNMAGHCPVGRRCGRVAWPFRWESVPTARCWRDLRLVDDQREALAFYRECAEGAVTVPVHRPGGKTGYVSWFSRSRRRLRSLSEECHDSIHLLSHLFMHHFDQVNDWTGSPVSARELTRRELECLTWAARGKTEEEIGLIIGRSPATARFHLRNAMAKLDASNRTHAVARACSRGLVVVD